MTFLDPFEFSFLNSSPLLSKEGTHTSPLSYRPKPHDQQINSDDEMNNQSPPEDLQIKICGSEK